MASTAQLVRAALLASAPAAVAVALSPPNDYARLIVGVGALLAGFPSAYVLVRAVDGD